MTTTDQTPRIAGYICLTREMTWGWGPTAADAVKAARKAGHGRGARKGERIVSALPAGALDAYVDQMGVIRWEWTDDAPDRFATTTMVEQPK